MAQMSVTTNNSNNHIPWMVVTKQELINNERKLIIKRIKHWISIVNDSIKFINKKLSINNDRITAFDMNANDISNKYLLFLTNYIKNKPLQIDPNRERYVTSIQNWLNIHREINNSNILFPDLIKYTERYINNLRENNLYRESLIYHCISSLFSSKLLFSGGNGNVSVPLISNNIINNNNNNISILIKNKYANNDNKYPMNYPNNHAKSDYFYTKFENTLNKLMKTVNNNNNNNNVKIETNNNNNKYINNINKHNNQINQILNTMNAGLTQSSASSSSSSSNSSTTSPSPPTSSSTSTTTTTTTTSVPIVTFTHQQHTMIIHLLNQLITTYNRQQLNIIYLNKRVKLLENKLDKQSVKIDNISKTKQNDNNNNNNNMNGIRRYPPLPQFQINNQNNNNQNQNNQNQNQNQNANPNNISPNIAIQLLNSHGIDVGKLQTLIKYGISNGSGTPNLNNNNNNNNHHHHRNNRNHNHNNHNNCNRNYNHNNNNNNQIQTINRNRINNSDVPNMLLSMLNGNVLNMLQNNNNNNNSSQSSSNNNNNNNNNISSLSALSSLSSSMMPNLPRLNAPNIEFGNAISSSNMNHNKHNQNHIIKETKPKIKKQPNDNVQAPVLGQLQHRKRYLDKKNNINNNNNNNGNITSQPPLKKRKLDQEVLNDHK